MDGICITVGMICGDGRADELRRALRSLTERSDGVPVCDEVVLVDTGERGEAEAAARSALAGRPVELKVVRFRPEPFDFARARNESLLAARGDWYLWVDSDDVLVGGAEILDERRKHDASAEALGRTESLKESLAKLPPDVLCVMAPYHYAYDATGRVTARIPRERVVRLRRDGERLPWAWANPVHEVLALNPQTCEGWVVSQDDCKRAWHHGFILSHRPADTDPSRSTERNRAILRREAERMGDAPHPQVLLHLGDVAIAGGDVAEGRVYLRQSIAAAVGDSLIQFGLLARISLAGTYLEAEDYGEALRAGLDAVAYAPSFADARVFCAEVFARRGEYVKAYNFIMDARPYKWLQGLTGYFSAQQETEALLLEARVCRECGLYDQAAEAAAKALDRDGNNWAAMDLRSRSVADGRNAKIREAFWTLFDGLRDHTEMVKADFLVNECAPHFLDADPDVHDARDRVRAQVKHLDGERAFCEAYDGNSHWTPFPISYLEEARKNLDDFPLSRAQWLRKHIEDSGARSCVEVGCSDGYISLWLAMCFPERRFLGVDVDPNALNVARERAEAYGLKNVSFEERDAVFHRAPREHAQQFDVVALFEVVEHVPHTPLAVDRVFSWLADGGRLLVTTPIGCFDIGLISPRENEPAMHVRAYSLDGLVTDLEGAGARVWNLHPEHATTAPAISGCWHAEVRRGEWEGRSVAFFAPNAPLAWGPETGRKEGIGGSEEAIVNVAERLANIGHKVSVYTNLSGDERVVGGVRWLSRDRLGRDGVAVEADVGVFWRCPSFRLSRARLKAQFAWLHDTNYDAPSSDWRRFDRIAVVSQTHARLIGYQVPDDVRERIIVLENGIDPSDFFGQFAPRVPGRLVYASSPDRGLETLLRMWPEIRRARPDATLRILYGWDIADKLRQLGNLRAGAPSYKGRIADLAEQPGVEWVGRVSWGQVARELLACDVWAYPSRFFEVSCITAMKAAAAGCRLVISDVGATKETLANIDPDAAHVVRFDSDEEDVQEVSDASFRCSLVDLIGSDEAESERMKRAEAARARYDWAHRAVEWDRAIEAVLLRPAPAAAEVAAT